ncbi:MAG: HAMP domain-containing sensor histidine kinase [Verrucomicrobia bacterium]|nr:HAMP domain-containing sensor histidine kinase [Verrucomicrobiota bacterium]
MKLRSIVLYWVLLLVPTLAICTATFRLLREEQGRQQLRERQSATARAEGLRDALLLGITAVQDELIDRLRRVPEGEAALLVEDWERGNPMVRHAFVWRSHEGLLYPPAQGAYNDTERRFVQRYEGLFAGRVTFDSASMSSLVQTEEARAPQKESLYTSVQKLKRSSRAMANPYYGEVATEQQKGGLNVLPAQVMPAMGWVPWFTENQLDLLGWIRYRPDGKVYGVELEMMAVLSRLVELLQGRVPDSWVVVLRNGMGSPIYQAGGSALQSASSPSASLALEPALPHWRLEVFAPPGSGVFAGQAFMLLSGLVLAIFVIAIVSGGGMLTWQAVRTSRDARRKTSFVSNVSHELKTPLTSIRMYAELMREGRVADPDKQQHYLSVIADESQRLTRLVNNVLDFGRLEQGHKKYTLLDVELGAFLKTFVDMNQLRFRNAGMTLDVANPADPVHVRTDLDALEQSLLNLVDNAIKYAHAGKAVTLQLVEARDVCRIHVLDRGPGIPRAQRKRIFEKFHRIDGSLTASQPGSGLGLSIARGLLRDLGGDLLYRPRDGGGSCFSIVLPNAKDA